MSEWETHDIQRRVIDILSQQTAKVVNGQGHHFGRPYLSAYQLAVEFRSLHPHILAHLPVGGRGTGAATGGESLAKYLALQLSRRIKAGTIPVEGAFLSDIHLSDISLLDAGNVVQAEVPLSMFRLRDGEEAE